MLVFSSGCFKIVVGMVLVSESVSGIGVFSLMVFVVDIVKLLVFVM